MECEKCRKDFPEEEISEHHIIPKSIGGTDKDGRVNFCKHHHDFLHFTLLSIVWKFVVDKEKAKTSIKRYTEKWVGKDLSSRYLL